MMKFPIAVMVVGAALAGGLAATARADVNDYCRNYAHDAIEQSRAARQSPRCFHFIRETPARWTLNYADHFNWCKSVYGSGDNSSERRARSAALNACLR
jgi:hypothetical protein